MALLQIISMPCYLIAIPFGLLSRLVRQIGLDFIQMGDFIADGFVKPEVRIRNLAEKWKNPNDRME